MSSPEALALELRQMAERRGYPDSELLKMAAAALETSAKPLPNKVNGVLVDAFVKKWEAIHDPGDGFRQTVRLVLSALAPPLWPIAAAGVPDGWQLVPKEPTEAMWGELARDIVMWDRFPVHTGAGLHRHLKSIGRTIPDWLAIEIPPTDQTPSKGAVAACIYKAMLAAVPSSVSQDNNISDHEQAGRASRP